MNRSTWVWIILGVVTVLLLIAVFSGGIDSRYNWSRTLRTEEKQPYDLSIFYETLKETAPAVEEIPVKSSIEKFSAKLLADPNSVYMYLGPRFYLNTRENEIFQEFVSAGGTLFISCTGFPENLMSSVGGLQYLQVNSIYDPSIDIRFSHPQLDTQLFHFEHRNRNEKASASWFFFQDKNYAFEDSFVWDPYKFQGMTPVSHIHGMPDFIRVKFGQGYIYLHSNPVFFSNLYMKTAQGRSYLQNVLRHLPNQNVWLDRSAGLEKLDADLGQGQMSILEYIRHYPGLYYSFLCLCIGVGLFILFGGRRVQRPIPVLERPRNNTLEFVNSIGYFYFREKNNKLVLEKSWNQFVFFVRQHYRMNIQQADPELPAKLALKAGVPLELITDILKKREFYRLYTQVSAEELAGMENALQQFYNAIKK